MSVSVIRPHAYLHLFFLLFWQLNAWFFVKSIGCWHPGCFFKPGVYPLMVDTRVAFSNLGCILWWLTVDTRVAFSNLGCILWWLTPGLLFQTWGVALVPGLSSACYLVVNMLDWIWRLLLIFAWPLHICYSIQRCIFVRLCCHVYCMFKVSVHSQYFVYSYLNWRMF